MFFGELKLERQLLRGAIVSTTYYGIHKTYTWYVLPFLQTVFGAMNYPP